MKLAEGMRVGLGVEELTCIAVVRSVNDEAIDLDLLDQVRYEERDGEVIIFVPDEQYETEPGTNRRLPIACEM